MKLPRLQISLRSLLLVTLFGASAGVLWMHFPAWRAVFAVSQPVRSHNFDTTGRFLLVHVHDGEVILKDLSGGVLWTLDKNYLAHFSEVSGVVVVEHQQDFTHKFWDLNRAVWIEHEPSKTYRFRKLSPSGRYAVLEHSFSVVIVETRTGLEWMRVNSSTPLDSVFFSPDESALALVFHNAVERFDLPAKKRTARFSYAGSNPILSKNLAVFAYLSSEKSEAVVCDAATGERRFSIPYPPKSDADADTRLSLEFSDDAEEILVADSGRQSCIAELWNVPTGTRKFDYLTLYPDRKHLRAYFSLHQTKIVAYCRDFDTWADIWNRADNSYIGRRMFEHPEDFNPDFLDGDSREMRRSRPTTVISGHRRLEFIPHSRDLFSYPSEGKWPRYPEGLAILSQFRPEAWWGVAWLPEFWSTVVLGGVLGWEVFGRRRAKGAA